MIYAPRLETTFCVDRAKRFWNRRPAILMAILTGRPNSDCSLGNCNAGLIYILSYRVPDRVDTEIGAIQENGVPRPGLFDLSPFRPVRARPRHRT